MNISQHPTTRDEQGAWDSYRKATFRYEEAVKRYGDKDTPEAKKALSAAKAVYDNVLAVFNPEAVADTN